MTRDDYLSFCAALPQTTHVQQWGGADVWKVGGKVFAIAWWADDAEPEITFKVSHIAFEVLGDQPGLRPAPYLASRGMKWIQHYDRPGLDDTALMAHLRDSHRIVSLGLTKKLQKQLGLNQP